jgi:hypothetical protein
MSHLVFSEAAQAKILELFRDSGESSPVAQLGTRSQAVTLDDEFREALKTQASSEDLAALGRREFERQKSGLSFALWVFVLDESDCLPRDVQTVGRLRLCMPSPLFEIFDNHVLDFRRGQFAITRSDGSAVDPRIQSLLNGR